MPDEEQNDQSLNHAWRYFELHANQRMSVFNFFLVLSGIVLAGLAATLQSSSPVPVFGLVLGLLLSLVSYIFWKLDQRVSFLIKFAECSLAELEGSLPEAGRLFRREPAASHGPQSTGNFWTRQWTYGRSFRVAFSIMALFGVGGAIWSLIHFIRHFQ